MNASPLVFIFLLMFGAGAYSEVLSTGTPVNTVSPIDFSPRFRIEPVFPVGQANFAFVTVNSTNGEERLQLGRMTQIFPARAILVNSNMASYDGDSENIMVLHAAPDNQLLAVFSFQLGFDFYDQNVRIYSMNDGQQVSGGLLNEHAFADVNKAVRPSTILDHCVDQERDFGVSETDLATLDFRLNVDDGSEVQPPVIRWHDNNTLSVTFQLLVEVFYPASEEFTVCDGYEDFTLFATVTDGVLHRDGFADPQPAAADPWVYNLAPAGRTPGYLTLDNNQIGFRNYFFLNGTIYTFYAYRQGMLAEGNIIKRFQFVPY